MGGDVLHALCALAAFFIPMGFAWFVVSRTARRHPHSHPQSHLRSQDSSRIRRRDRPMR